MSGTINFPANPTVGQTYTFNNTTWVWNGTVWTNANTGANFMPIAGGAFTGPISSPGVTNGSNAAAGQVGEWQQVVVTTPVAVGASGSTTTVATLSLTAGDWDVEGAVGLGSSGATMTAIQVLTSWGGSSGPIQPMLAVINSSDTPATMIGFGNGTTIDGGRQRISVSSPTTVSIQVVVQYVVWGSSGVFINAVGFIGARRAR